MSIERDAVFSHKYEKRLTPAAIVVGLVRRFCNEWRRPQGAADDPRWSNPLFKDWAAATKKLVTQDVEPCVQKQ